MTTDKTNVPETQGENTKGRIEALGVDLNKLPIAASYEELEASLPEVAVMKGFDQRNDVHSLTLDKHTRELVRHMEEDPFIQSHPKKDLILLAGKLHDLGKISPAGQQVNPKDPEKRQYVDHEIESERMAREILSHRFDMPEEDREFVAKLTGLHASALNLVNNFQTNNQPKGKDLKAYDEFMKKVEEIPGDMDMESKMRIVFAFNRADKMSGYNEKSDVNNESVKNIIEKSKAHVKILDEMVKALPILVAAIIGRRNGDQTAGITKTADGKYEYKKPEVKEKKSEIPDALKPLGKILRYKMSAVAEAYPTLLAKKDNPQAFNGIVNGVLKKKIGLTDEQVEAVLKTLKSKEAPKEISKFDLITKELREYGETHGLRGLEGRVQRGLDPAGMLAYSETRAKVEKVANALGADMKEVDKLTIELHVGAIWSHADELANPKDPNLLVWMVTGEACISEKETEGDLTPEKFLKDVNRVNRLLDEAVADPKAFIERSKKNMINDSRQKFELVDGIPFSKLDDGFLAAAINGHKVAIVEDENKLLFVGANKLDYSVLEKQGLTAQKREDRGRESNFYVDKEGKDVVKVLYPGFCIVFDGNMEVSKTLARTA